ncbi:hypothetical protein [Thermocatellispora tengchongensis]
MAAPALLSSTIVQLPSLARKAVARRSGVPVSTATTWLCAGT